MKKLLGVLVVIVAIVGGYFAYNASTKLDPKFLIIKDAAAYGVFDLQSSDFKNVVKGFEQAVEINKDSVDLKKANEFIKSLNEAKDKANKVYIIGRIKGVQSGADDNVIVFDFGASHSFVKLFLDNDFSKKGDYYYSKNIKYGQNVMISHKGYYIMAQSKATLDYYLAELDKKKINENLYARVTKSMQVSFELEKLGAMDGYFDIFVNYPNPGELKMKAVIENSLMNPYQFNLGKDRKLDKYVGKNSLYFSIRGLSKFAQQAVQSASMFGGDKFSMRDAMQVNNFVDKIKDEVVVNSDFNDFQAVALLKHPEDVKTFLKLSGAQLDGDKYKLTQKGKTTTFEFIEDKLFVNMDKEFKGGENVDKNNFLLVRVENIPEYNFGFNFNIVGFDDKIEINAGVDKGLTDLLVKTAFVK